MTLFLAIVFVANPGALPPLADLEPFPTLDVAEARLVEIEKQIRVLAKEPASANRNAAFPLVEHQLDCWEVLREAHRPQTAGHANDELTRRRALGLLKRLLGESDYAAGKMP